MKDQKFIFKGEAPLRLDAYLAGVLDGYPRSLCKILVQNGGALVNGKTVKPAWPLQEGDEISVHFTKSRPSADKFRAMLLLEDKHIAVISKPSGLLAHPLKPSWADTPDIVFSGEETLAALILAAYPASAVNGLARAGLVHRLDRETSGVMVIAKTPAAQESLVSQFQNRTVNKTYLCIAQGAVKDERGIINVPIGRVTGGKIKASAIGRDAVTEYRVIGREKGFSLLELHPKTGRTNQLRVHLAWLGYPVAGDEVYGKKAAPRLMLHAKRLEFDHPHTGGRVTVEAAIPEDFRKFWASK